MPRACTWPTKCAWARSTAAVPPGRVRHADPPPLLRNASGLERGPIRPWSTMARSPRWPARWRSAALRAMRRRCSAWPSAALWPPGTSRRKGNITSWLNELAFVPVDYREDAPIDEWSAIPGWARNTSRNRPWAGLLAPAGIDLPQRHDAPVKFGTRAAAHGRGRRARPQDLSDHRRLFWLTTSPPTPISTRCAICSSWAACYRRGRRSDSLHRRRSPHRRVPEIAERIRYHTPARRRSATARPSLPPAFRPLPFRRPTDAIPQIRRGSCLCPTVSRQTPPLPALLTCASPRTRTISKSWPLQRRAGMLRPQGQSGSPAWW